MAPPKAVSNNSNQPAPVAPPPVEANLSEGQAAAAFGDKPIVTPEPQYADQAAGVEGPAEAPVEAESQPSEASSYRGFHSPTIFDRFHLVVSGGGILNQPRVGETRPAYAEGVPNYTGGVVALRPGFSVFRNQLLNVQAFAEIAVQPMTTAPNQPGQPKLSVTATGLGAGADVTVFPATEKVSFGVNFALAYVGLSGRQVDIGAPEAKHLRFQGGLGVLAGGSIGFLNHSFGISAGAQVMATPAHLPTADGREHLATHRPAATFGIFIDAMEIYRTFTGKNKAYAWGR